MFYKYFDICKIEGTHAFARILSNIVFKDLHVLKLCTYAVWLALILSGYQTCS